MPYKAPTDDYEFILGRLLSFDKVLSAPKYSDTNFDDCIAILAAAGKLAEEVLEPLQFSGDKNPSRLENGIVTTPPRYADGFRAIAQGGWVGMSADSAYGGMDLPVSLRNAVNEMSNGACASLGLAPLLTQSQIEALQAHGSEHLKSIYLPKLISGEWMGTMCMTESDAGSDIGSLKTKAKPIGNGEYEITGEKIYISWADADFAENISHFVLARLPDAAAGSKGLSLFLVPKLLPGKEGELGPRNHVQVVSLESKLGLHGSPTGVLQFDGAKGWLIGAPGGGIAAMFTMMNSARLGVGTQGVAIGDAALSLAQRFAETRRQGRPPSASGIDTILGHPDIRRRLMVCKANLFAARAICADCAYSMDMGQCSGDTSWHDRAAFLTPIAKAYGSDSGVETALVALQIHGGLGYIESSGAAQYLRDAVVTTIYEGTNGIQAMDLVGRKLADQGQIAFGMISEIRETASACLALEPKLSELLFSAADKVSEATDWLISAKETADRNVAAGPYLRAFALLLGAHYHARALAAEKGSGSRSALARLFFNRSLGHCGTLCEEVCCGSADIFPIPDSDNQGEHALQSARTA